MCCKVSDYRCMLKLFRSETKPLSRLPLALGGASYLAHYCKCATHRTRHRASRYLFIFSARLNLPPFRLQHSLLPFSKLPLCPHPHPHSASGVKFRNAAESRLRHDWTEPGSALHLRPSTDPSYEEDAQLVFLAHGSLELAQSLSEASCRRT